jgi:hypothetical protein
MLGRNSGKMYIRGRISNDIMMPRMRKMYVGAEARAISPQG